MTTCTPEELVRVVSQADPPFDILCSDCTRIFPVKGYWATDFPDIDGTTLRRSRIGTLKTSALHGCHLCALLLRTFTPNETRVFSQEYQPFERQRYELKILPDSYGWILQITLYLPALVHLGLGTIIKQTLLAKIDEGPTSLKDRLSGVSVRSSSHDLAIVGQRCLSSTNLSEFSLSQVQRWMSLCVHEHVECRSISSIPGLQPMLPTRLLQLEGDDEQLTVCLVETCQIDRQVPYATLSYRWDDATKSVQLKKKNLKFKVSLPVGKFPQTFRDAFYVARKLSIRYLWIDSLCIVQDCQLDWERESVHMGTYYASAAINFAATAACDDAAGLKSTRNPLAIAPCILRREAPARETMSSRFLCWRPQDFSDNVDRSALYKRGWTFQERLLSHRTIHFGNQLFWECASLRASEAFPVGVDLPEIFNDDYGQTLKRRLRSTFDCDVTTEVVAELYQTWSSIVRVYSGMDLTRGSDKLIAVQGIAHSLIRRYHLSEEDYVFGLWKPCFPYHLIWGRNRDFLEEYEAVEEYRAPSWSWASINGRFRFIERPGLFSQELVAVDLDRDKDRRPKDKCKISIILRGKLLAVLTETLTPQPDQGTTSFPLLGISCGIRNGIRSKSLVIELDIPGPLKVSTIMLLPVINNFGLVRGLVLERRSGTGRGVYRRLGLFNWQGMYLYDQSEIDSSSATILLDPDNFTAFDADSDFPYIIEIN